MNSLRVPGFTAEAALHASSRTYRSLGGAHTTLGAGALTPATAKDGKLEWIDCNDFPANNFCRECGNTGPDAAVCCRDDYCVVIDKTPRVGGRHWGSRFTAGRMSLARG